jgi:hypothetical protein
MYILQLFQNKKIRTLEFRLELYYLASARSGGSLIGLLDPTLFHNSYLRIRILNICSYLTKTIKVSR